MMHDKNVLSQVIVNLIHILIYLSSMIFTDTVVFLINKHTNFEKRY